MCLSLPRSISNRDKSASLIIIFVGLLVLSYGVFTLSFFIYLGIFLGITWTGSVHLLFLGLTMFSALSCVIVGVTMIYKAFSDQSLGGSKQ